MGDPHADNKTTSHFAGRLRGKALRTLLGLLLGMGIGGLFSFLLAVHDPIGASLRSGQPEIVLYFGPLLVLVGMFYLAVALHELGHLVAGLAVGFHFRFCTIGPLKIERRGDRLRFGLSLRFLGGGMAGTVPVDDRNLRRREALMIAGGPVASLLVGLVTGGLALSPDLTSRFGPWAGLSVAWLAVVSLALVPVALLPKRTGGLDTDGGLLRVLLRGGPRAERYLALVAFNGATLGRGLRPREQDPELIARALAYRDGTAQDVSADLTAYSHAFDSGDFVAAGRHLDSAIAGIEQYPAPFRPEVYLIAAYFAAAHRDDAAAARAFFARAGSAGLLEAPNTRPAAEAALLLIEGHPAEARCKAEEALALTERSLNPGGDRASADAIRALIARADAALQTPVPGPGAATCPPDAAPV